MEFGKPTFGIEPEGFNAVDMSFAVCELVLPMIDAIMLFYSPGQQGHCSRASDPNG